MILVMTFLTTTEPVGKNAFGIREWIDKSTMCKYNSHGVTDP